MKATEITAENKSKFLDANKEAFVALVCDAEFTGQSDLVQEAVKALENCDEIKEKIAIATVDVEKNNELATELSIVSVPVVVCVIKGKTVKKIDTLEPKKLVNILKEELHRNALLSLESSDGDADSKKDFNKYLKELTNRASVMIFMKGEPSAPRCGFSKQLVEMLGKYDIKYATFDILQDEDVRQGLKEYSDWPTYPQIYVKGEFIGGLDILKQMEEAGELESTLKV